MGVVKKLGGNGELKTLTRAFMPLLEVCGNQKTMAYWIVE
jgi:hypothetical protein